MRYIKSLIHRMLFGKPLCVITYHAEHEEDNIHYWVDACSDLLGMSEQVDYLGGYDCYAMVDLGRTLEKLYPFHRYVIRDYGGDEVADFTKSLYQQSVAK